jgi:non-canonical purine NTP pyrophosphatase (RdgB/HAM1 family)
MNTVMSKEIIFATGNAGKVATLQRLVDRLSVDVLIVQKPLDLLEPQADTAEEVARSKAQQAYAQLGQPVLVDDSSFHIAALGGFPGPYIKYMLTTIGIEGIIEFMHGKHDRNAYFLSSLIYMDEEGREHAFEDSPYTGVITEEIDDFDSETAWSDLYKIFIPEGSEKTLARMTSKDHENREKKRVDAYMSFCEWLKAGR